MKAELTTEKPFMYGWEYIVKEETKLDFERIYGPNGDWVQLFQKVKGDKKWKT